MTETFLWQSAGLAWLVVCAAAAGARVKRIPLTAAEWWRIAQVAVFVIACFGLVTEGRGCASTKTPDCEQDC